MPWALKDCSFIHRRRRDLMITVSTFWDRANLGYQTASYRWLRRRVWKSQTAGQSARSFWNCCSSILPDIPVRTFWLHRRKKSPRSAVLWNNYINEHYFGEITLEVFESSGPYQQILSGALRLKPEDFPHCFPLTQERLSEAVHSLETF